MRNYYGIVQANVESERKELMSLLNKTENKREFGRQRRKKPKTKRKMHFVLKS